MRLDPAQSADGWRTAAAPDRRHERVAGGVCHAH
jgi:hypothetical protein